MARSEGVRRLSILGGVLGLLFYFFAVWVFELEIDSYAEILVGLAISFGLGWAMVRMVAWVIEGFRRDRGK